MILSTNGQQLWFTCSFNSLTNPTYVVYTNFKERQCPALLKTEDQLLKTFLHISGVAYI